MYTDGQRAIQMIADPATPLPTQTPAVKTAAQAFVLMRPMQIEALCATITTAMTVTAGIMQLLHRPTPGSASGQTVVGTLTFPVAGSAIGQQVYKKIAPFRAMPGAQLIWELTQASTAGAVIPGILVSETTEHPSGIPAMVASA